MTLASWCGRRNRPMGRMYSALLASQRQRALADAAERAAKQRHLRRHSTAVTQICDAPPRVQCYNGRELAAVNELPSGNGCRHWRLRLALDEPSDSIGSPRSISNSSLREVDEELTGEELATYLYQVNCHIGGLT